VSAAAERAEREFLELVVHELRTPIAVIIGLAATLAARRKELAEGRIDESLVRIQAAGELLARMVDDLLDLAQVEAGRFRVVIESVALAKVIRRALENAPAPAGYDVEVSVADGLWVAADAARLEQVFVNLLTNAYRYGGPRIRVETTRVAEGVVTTVADDGPGVGAELAGRLFEKFSRGTSDGRGAGLGLAIVRGLVEAFGGRAWYEAGQPGGARFVVCLNEAGESPENQEPCFGTAEMD